MPRPRPSCLVALSLLALLAGCGEEGPVSSGRQAALSPAPTQPTITAFQAPPAVSRGAARAGRSTRASATPGATEAGGDPNGARRVPAAPSRACAPDTCDASGTVRASARARLTPVVASFCNSTATDPLEQAGSAARAALAERSTKAMLAVQRRLLRAAETAPPGAACAVNILNFVVQTWQTGGSRFPGADVAAEVSAIRAFQREHGLSSVLPGF